MTMGSKARGYLAGPGAEVERAVAHAAELTARGYVLTMPWWERVAEERQRGWMSDADVPAEYMRENAVMNRRGIDLADFIVALCKLHGGVSPGTAGEVAYAIGLHYAERIESVRNMVIMVGDPRGFVWAHDPCVIVVPTMTDAIALLSDRYCGQWTGRS